MIEWAKDKKSFTFPDVAQLFGAFKTGIGFSEEHIHWQIHQELLKIEPYADQLTENGKYDFELAVEPNFTLRATRKDKV
jgi:hypothetical protein